ncbi:MAG: CRISPR-associated endonuclease Cas2 [Candidatus Rokubacteria bacterium]|nr:CRISPR-associated endonuclease Cas2 [Candidatus Rokubacteria bacterium]
MRRVCVVSYDICDPKRWRHVYRIMRGFGEHLQLSVFLCDLPPIQRARMAAALEGVIDHQEDQVLLIDLGATETSPVKSIAALGRPLDVRERGSIVV